MSGRWSTVRTRDGRDLQVLAYPGNDVALVLHLGTPSAAVDVPMLRAAVDAHGWTLVTFSRPGYATSTRKPGRSVSDVAADTSDVLDHLGLSDFVTLGWSGGGPHALACAALLPGRCRAAATLAGVAPYPAAGLDWSAGMGPENVEEFAAAVESPSACAAILEPQVGQLSSVTGEQVADALGGLVSDVDRAALTGEFADMTAAAFRAAVSTGISGWLDDDLAFVKPWGFDVADIAVPVAVWQGAQDRMVPFAHGKWLADNVAGARSHLFDDEGHLSLVERMPDVLADLAGVAGLPTSRG
jgi:pimeloyl-ACP methyl ester carboxylesterase